MKKLKNGNTNLDFAPHPMLKKGGRKVFLFSPFPSKSPLYYTILYYYYYTILNNLHYIKPIKT